MFAGLLAVGCSDDDAVVVDTDDPSPSGEYDFADWCDDRETLVVHTELNPDHSLAVIVDELEEVQGTLRYTPEDHTWQEHLPVFRATVREVRGRPDFAFAWHDDLQEAEVSPTEGETMLLSPRPPQVFEQLSDEHAVVLLTRLVGRPDEGEGRGEPTFVASAAIPMGGGAEPSYGPIAPCPDEMDQEISDLASAIGMDRDALIDDLLAGGTEVEQHAMTDPYAPLPWEDTDPQRRILDPGFTPAEVLDSLRYVALPVAVPDDWRGSDAVLCTQSALGWNSCYALFDGRHQVTVMEAYVEPGEPLELHVLAEDLDFDVAPMHSVQLSWADVEQLDSFEALNVSEMSAVLRLTGDLHGSHLEAEVEVR